MDPDKFDAYLFNSDHPANQSKSKGWRDTFGIGPGDGPLLERLIREQLRKADIVETESRVVGEAPREVTRKWALSIPEFGVPGRRPGRVVTVWAQDPGEEYPHMVTAIARP